MKIMGIDYGSKRVGIASTDETGHFALPRTVFENDDSLLDKVLEFKETEGIERVVIGESKNFAGNANPIQADIEHFKEELRKHGVDVVSQAEVLTTMEARRLQGNTEMTDASAAAIILKSYLDTMYNKDV